MFLNNYYGCTETSQETQGRANDLAVEFQEEHVFEKYLDVPVKTVVMDRILEPGQERG